MKKQIFSKMTLVVAMVAGLTACSNDDSNENMVSNQKVTINVEELEAFQATDGTPQTGGMTRALPAEYEENDNIKRGTTFEMGDAIGIFEVSGGTVTAANVPYYFSGQVWDSSTAISFDAGKTYYAYFPYKADLNVSSVDASAATAEAFFANVISGWTVEDDQSSYANYKASDLMVGAGTITVEGGGNTVLNFQMAHQMGLVVLNLGQVKHMLRSGRYYWFDQVNKKCKGTTGGDTYYKPSYIEDEYRAIVPLNTYATFCATDDEWAVNAYITQKGHYQLYDIGCTADDPNAGVKYFDLTEGDVMYSDGSLLHVTNDNNDLRMQRSADAIGVVVFVSDGSAEDQRVIDPSLNSDGMLKCEFSHGLVMGIYPWETHLTWGATSNGSTDTGGLQSRISRATYQYAANHTVKKYFSVAAAINDFDGIYTTELISHGTNSGYNAWYANRNDICPTGANVHNSGWFIPGLGQLIHSLLKTGVISPATYTTMKNNSGIYLNFTADRTIWSNYMLAAIGSTNPVNTRVFTNVRMGWLTSTYYPHKDGVNWHVTIFDTYWNDPSNYTRIYCKDRGTDGDYPGDTALMLAF